MLDINSFSFPLFKVSPRCLPFTHCWLSCCVQGLKEPEELLPESFVLPNLPEEGASLEVRVKHLLTPNEVFDKVAGGFYSE